jgi:hypothetical protein
MTPVRVGSIALHGTLEASAAADVTTPPIGAIARAERTTTALPSLLIGRTFL